jgi:hypothetical protein
MALPTTFDNLLDKILPHMISKQQINVRTLGGRIACDSDQQNTNENNVKKLKEKIVL